MSELEKNENINKDECPFSWKNYFRSIWDELFLMVRYNLMFLLCCISVVTIPAAITAMHHVFVRVARGEKPGFKEDALPVFKREFGRSLLAGVLILLALLVSVTGFLFYIRFASESLFLMIPAVISGSIALLVYLMSSYIFTMLAILDLSLKDIIKNAYMLAILNIKYSLCSGIYILIIAAIGVLLFPVTVPLSLMVLFSLAMFTSAYFSYYGIKKCILKHRDSDVRKTNAIKTSIADLSKSKKGGEHARVNLSDQIT